MMTLDLALITWQPQGLQRVAAMNLPRVDGVRYIVSWQKHDNAPVPPAVSERPDIEVWRTDTTTISENRNNALSHCSADIVLNADDDVIYTAQGLRAVISTFARDKEVQFACFKFDFGDRTKPYPDHVCDLARMPKGLWFGTIEMAVRRNSPAGELRFDLRFGPGSKYLGTGEDEYYLLQARRRGYVCRFYPITIGAHPSATHASQRITDKKIVRGMGAVIAATYRVTALPRLVLKAWRMKKAGQYDFLPGLVSLFKGYLYYIFTR
jgi:hypothetical protein